MVSHNPINLAHSGVSQAERLLPALKENHFLVDEMSFETLLLLAKDIASQLNFFDLDNNKEGSWELLFTNNEVVVMALILGVDCAGEKIRFQHLQTSDLDAALTYLLTRYSNIDKWYRHLLLSDNSAAYQLHLKISSVIENRLQEEFFTLLRLSPLLGKNYLKQQTFSEFAPIWGSVEQEIQQIILLDNQPQDLPTANSRQLLDRCFSTLNNSVLYIQADTKNYLADALKNSNHEPTIALLMTFLKLFKRAQNKVNKFTDRHLDFYYKNLLKFSLLSGKADSAYLLLALEKGNNEPQQINIGHQFSADKDDDFNDIVYRATQNMQISDGNVEHVNTLFLQRNPFISPEKELNYVTRLVSNSLRLGKNHGPEQSISVFGADKGPVDVNVVSLGVAISADILHLKEGLRKISITLGLVEPGKLGGKVLAALNNPADSHAKQKEILTDIFNQFLHDEAELLPPLQVPTALHALVQQFLVKPDKLLISYSPERQANEVYKMFLFTLLKLANKEHYTQKILGKIFCRHTLVRDNFLSENDITLIQHKCDNLPDSEGMQRILRLLTQDKQRTFFELYRDIFSIKISTEHGWLELNDYIIHPLDSSNAEACELYYGFNCELLLKPEFPEVIACSNELHGEHWQLTEPVIQFAIKPQATFYPYSIFKELCLASIIIEAQVTGLTELVAYNQFGRLEPSKTFSPFGPQANNQAYFIFSNDEIAHKQLVDLSINISWSDLPLNFDGFSEHYQQYDERYDNSSFKVDFLFLKDGQWRSGNGQARHSLFNSQVACNTLDTQTRLNIDLSQDFKAARRKNNSDNFDYTVKSRNGFFKLTLVEPNNGFGQQQYVRLLTRYLIENSKNKKQQTLPNLPYSPKINRVSMDYRAKSTIKLGDQHPHDVTGVSIVHLHPFGFEKIYPAARKALQQNTHFLFPNYRYEGNLFIGMSGEVDGKPLNLFFHLDEKASLHRDHQGKEIDWFYLHHNQWHKLQDRHIISDSTNGFLTSGIITFDIPVCSDSNNTVMQPDLFWLRASTNINVAAYGNCFCITTHGIKVTRNASSATDALAESDNLTSPIVISNHWQSIDKLAGVKNINQTVATFGGRRMENEIQLKQRVSERLRHKDRAVTPWDYERLILQKFPEIDWVKCLSNVIFSQQGQFPGHVLILVRKKVLDCQHLGCDNYKISINELLKIQQYIQSKSASFVNIDVRAPEYEKIQIRCSISLIAGQQQGLALQRLNEQLSTLLCPWNATGLNKGIDWLLDIKEIESFINRLPYINFVTDFSVLHISHDDNDEERYYRLNDSVTLQHRRDEKKKDHTKLCIRPQYPWSILMPVAQHALKLCSAMKVIEPKSTGICELEIGNNFIIQDDNINGIKKLPDETIRGQVND